jgi:hypothetical protein
MQESEKNLPQPEYDKAGNLVLQARNYVENLKILRRLLGLGTGLKVWEVVHKSRKHSDRFPVLRHIFNLYKRDEQKIIKISHEALNQISEEFSNMIFGSEKDNLPPPEEEIDLTDDPDSSRADWTGGSTKIPEIDETEL